MSTPYILSCIGAMALTTYLVRMLPLTLIRKKMKNAFIKAFLSYVPYAVLAAMTFPAVLYSTGGVISGLLGFVCALLMALGGRSLLAVSMSAALTVFVAELIMKLF